MPRLLVPLLSLKPESASGLTYARHLVPALTRALGAEQVRVLGTPFIDEQLSPLGCSVEVVRVPQGRPLRLLATRLLVPAAVRRHRAAALFVPDGQLVPAPHLPPSVVALHHHLNFSRPQGQALSQRLYWKLWFDRAMRRSCRRAAALLAPSAAFARELEDFLPEASGKLFVVPHGAGPSFRPEGPARRFASPHVLVVGNPSPYKNVTGAVAAFLRATTGLPHLLAVVGLNEAELGSAAREAGASEAERGRLLALGRLPLEELAPLYRGAEALLFPSRVESFGLPVVEAMACGTPVVASNLPSLVELGGQALLTAPAEDSGGLAAALRRLLEDEGEAARMRGLGLARARDLTWERAAGRIASILRRLAPELAEGESGA